MPTTRPVLPELPEHPGSPAPAADGVPQQLVDRYGRTVRDLRLSITDRCNLRCTYCMPAQGLQWLPTPLLAQIDQLPFTFQHTLLEQSEGFARVEILRTA